MRWRGCERNGVQGASCRKCACLRCRVGAPNQAPKCDTRYALRSFECGRIAEAITCLRLDECVVFAPLAVHCPSFSHLHAGVWRWSRAMSPARDVWLSHLLWGPPAAARVRECTLMKQDLEQVLWRVI